MTQRQVVTAAKLSIDEQIKEMLALVVETGFRTGDPERLAARTAILATLKWIQEHQDVIRQVHYQFLDQRQASQAVDTEED